MAPGESTSRLDLSHLRRQARTALELAIVELAPNDLIDRLALVTGLLEAIDAAPDVLSALADLGKRQHAKIELVRNGRSRTVDATLAENAPPAWLRNWMKPFEAHHMFDDSYWFRPWRRPLDETNRDTKSNNASNWLDKLRDLFAPEHAPIYQRS